MWIFWKEEGVRICRKEERVRITGKEERTKTDGEEDPIKEIVECEKRARNGMRRDGKVS